MESYRSVHQVYQRRARRRVDDNAVENIGYSVPCVPVTPAVPKPLQVYARKQWRVKRRLRVDSADSAAMNILGEKMEVGLSGERGQGSNGTVLLKFSVATDEELPKSETDGQEEAGDGAGVADLLEAFSAEDAALTGISFTELLSSSIVNVESLSMEREPAASDGDHDNQKEQADKDDATCSISFGPNGASRTMGCISTEHPLAPSTPLHCRYAHKIGRVNIDLNKTPRQKPKKKKKKNKHVTPKVATERKPVRTPKPKTRENGSCARKRKYVSRKDAVEGSSTPSIEESSKKNLRRKGLMDTPITPTEDAVNKYPKGLVGEVADSNLELRETSCKRYLNFDDGSVLQDIKLKVQSRLITRSQCLITSRKVGPNFPEKCKRRRKARLRKAMHVDFPCFPINFKKRRSARSCRANMFILCSSISEFVHEKQRKQRKLRKRKMQVKSTHSIQKEFLDHTNASACNFLATKGISHSLHSRELEDIIQKLMRLNIEDEVGTLVLYKPKPKTPKVLLDEETITAFNQLMMSERADGDNCGEMDWQNDEKWEKERNKFQELVENFISKMHLILGDRKFLSWKGSVVDSVVGVFLTQNVSDYLSSSAFMSLCAKFPKVCVNNRECSKPLVSDTGSIGSEEKDAQVIKIELNESSNLIEEKRCVQNMPPLCGMSMKDTNVKNVQVEVKTPSSGEKKKSMSQKKKVDPAEWEKLRKMYSTDARNENHMDSLDWEAVRCAKLEELAETIKERGQNNIIASRIQDFLSGLVRLHGSIDLEWLRNCPTNKVKDYLLEVDGLGLKSVECVRLLSLQHMAFPVDTNVGRIAVRLGWVPLQPLPDNLPLHQLERYPPMDDIQKYLWPRLCTLDQRTLYELHYHLITFGKVFCTKRSPNCNACPLRDNCKHFASAFASAFPLPATSHGESRVTSVIPIEYIGSNLTSSLIGEFDSWLESNNRTTNCEPIIEVPPSPEPETCNPPLKDIEDLCLDNDRNEDDDSAIPTIKLNSSEFLANLRSFMDENNMPIQENSTALVALTASDASIPLPKLKYVSRLRTVHYVYKLPDDHVVLRSLERRDPDDQCPYLLAAWPTETGCESQISGECCNEEGCSSCHTREDCTSETIKGTILIPCRTAMRGSFPLNGTYFQVNEVFADNESSRHPIDVPRSSLWSLPRRLTYFGTSTNTIFRGLSTAEIQNCFWRGFICVRGIDRKTGAPRPLSTQFHRSVSKQGKGFVYDDQ